MKLFPDLSLSGENVPTKNNSAHRTSQKKKINNMKIIKLSPLVFFLFFFSNYKEN